MVEFVHNGMTECLTLTASGRAWGLKVIEHGRLEFIWAVIEAKLGLAAIETCDAAWSREANASVNIQVDYVSCFGAKL
jgi:hypothetical protein